MTKINSTKLISKVFFAYLLNELLKRNSYVMSIKKTRTQ